MIEKSVLGSIGRKVRVNHALEHATITVLSGKVSDVVLRGRSNRHGFYVLGDVNTDVLRQAAYEALGRLCAGESELAIHPFCGTNLAVAGLLCGTASAVASRRARRGEALPLSILAAIVALALSQPLGLWAQRVLTTSADATGVQIVDVRRKSFLGRPLHFVSTSQ